MSNYAASSANILLHGIYLINVNEENCSTGEKYNRGDVYMYNGNI